MVGVEARLKPGGDKVPQPSVKVAGEGDRDVRGPERRHYLEGRRLQVGKIEQCQPREALELRRGQVVDLLLAPDVEARPAECA